MVAPRALVFGPLVKQNEDSGKKIVEDREEKSGVPTFSLPFCIPFPFSVKQCISEAHLHIRENPDYPDMFSCNV